MILIFKKKSIFSYLIATILNFANCRVLITSSSKSYFIKKLDKLGFKMQCERLIYADMTEQKFDDLSRVNGDANKISNFCVNKLYENVNHLKKLSKFFPNINNIDEKMKLFFFQYYDELFPSQQSIIAWLEASIYKDNLIINLSALKPGTKCFWRKSNLKVLFILNYFNFFINLISSLLLTIFKKTLSVLRFYYKNNQKNNSSLKKSYNVNHLSDVLFFPHSSVVTFGHPPKDHFYADKIHSPFHPSKIIHLDLNEIKNIDLEKNRMKKYFQTDFIYYERLVNTYFPWYDVIKILNEILKKIIKSKFKNLGHNILYYGIILKSFIVYKRYCKSLEPYSSAKIALIGYEMLFPKALSFALETLKIKSICITERFQAQYKNNKTFLVHTLFSISNNSSKIINESERFFANNIFPVGQVRTDHFFDNCKIKSKYKEQIVILDYHIENDLEAQKFKTILNWKNDKNFREEIFHLAENNPDKEFIFRGKNCNWYKNKMYSDLISKVDKLPNLRVDTDYSKNYWMSYHLCASADLIIARPTSLAEECISKGYNVIVVDYGLNYITAVKNLLPKQIKEYYCNSHQELIYKFQYWNKHKYILPNEKKIMIQKNLFSNLTDGNIKIRIQKLLNKIYSETQ